MVQIFSKFLVLGGASILGVSLVPVIRLISELPRTSVRQRWYLLLGFLVFFIVGYSGYAALTWNSSQTLEDLIVPSVFFGGSLFVWVVCTFSLRTVKDIRRIVSLEEENITDPLMGIYNRRYLERRIKEECARSLRYNIPLSAMMIDIDRFKTLNDTFGHQTGDLVLTQLAQVLRENSRVADLVFRYGGEEILILAPNTNIASALELSERLRSIVENTSFDITKISKNPSRLQITISIGVACVQGEGSDAEELIRHADEALYEAKKTGRNRVVAHPPPEHKHH